MRSVCKGEPVRKRVERRPRPTCKVPADVLDRPKVLVNDQVDDLLGRDVSGVGKGVGAFDAWKGKGEKKKKKKEESTRRNGERKGDETNRGYCKTRIRQDGLCLT